MGIGIVLLAWTVVGSILAGVAALTLGVLAAHFTRGALRERRRVILAAALFPFLSMGWVCAVFVFQAVINEAFLHRDPVWATPGNALCLTDMPF